jgi:hypothetical protein
VPQDRPRGRAGKRRCCCSIAGNRHPRPRPGQERESHHEITVGADSAIEGDQDSEFGANVEIDLHADLDFYDDRTLPPFHPVFLIFFVLMGRLEGASIKASYLPLVN